MTNRHDWKRYLPVTSWAGGNNNVWRIIIYLLLTSEPDANEDWKEEETDELFQLHAEYSGRDNMLDSIVEGLQVNNIFKTKQQVKISWQKENTKHYT